MRVSIIADAAESERSSYDYLKYLAMQTEIHSISESTDHIGSVNSCGRRGKSLPREMNDKEKSNSSRQSS